MSVTSVDKDFDNLTLTLVADFDAPVERVWRLWSDPRQLERWWGPSEYPATVEDHDLSPGGGVAYFMTGPQGDKSRGLWQITEVTPPTSLEFVDRFADPDGTPLPDAPPTTVQVRLTEHEGGTRMRVRSLFASPEHMEELVRLGAPEVFATCVGQMDTLLAE
ncbi:SRPBCC family protein [Actinomadura hibisca]|uniref:SRPBCC family protein n=1 Tax=Actinomadura hibisca TaxID=68565 RepID=UPI0008336075|nr:SRPBCC domain-containing protein [Actinomadura hibisca]